MELVIVRHGQAGESEGGKDRDRALTAGGRRQAALIGAQIAAGGPARVVASGYRRTRETAERIGEALGTDVIFDSRLELGTASEALAVVEELRASRLARVVVVGHQPQLCALLAVLGEGLGARGESVPLGTGQGYRLLVPDEGVMVGACRVVEHLPARVP
ncbi:MAG: histidine phosphatase family protein [Phycisphaerales bacterium]|nr:histidine phosphatase family protein [Phycisphaerales bacterium]